MKLVTLFSCLLAVCSSAALGNSNRADFTIAFHDIETDLKIITTSVMPEEYLPVQTSASALALQGSLRKTESGWEWQAPASPGHYNISFQQADQEILLRVFVLTPFTNGEQEALQGFTIGSYQKELFRGLPTYSAPRGFINVTDDLAGLQVSPSFSINQFVSKQQPGHDDATYLLVLPSMLIKLETLLEAANEKGWRAPTLYVMSGFRTPFYNRAIGNNTTTSRHLYGGAADVWIDGDEDGLMDDLNGDGRIDRQDALTLASLAESLASRGGRNWPPGGIGIYDSTPAHGPFVHIDSRGYRARW